MQRSLGVGIIGTGVGVRMLIPGFRATGKAEIIAVSGSSAARAAQLAGGLDVSVLTGDYRQVCTDDRVELICVASPNDLHVEHAHAALATGKHVYLEKPTGIDAKQAGQIAHLAAGNDHLVVVGHQLRFNPYLRAMRDAIESELVGRVYHLSIAQHGSGFTNPAREWTWEFDLDRGGGVRRQWDRTWSTSPDTCLVPSL